MAISSPTQAKVPRINKISDNNDIKGANDNNDKNDNKEDNDENNNHSNSNSPASKRHACEQDRIDLHVHKYVYTFGIEMKVKS